MQRLQGSWNESGKGLFLPQWRMSTCMESHQQESDLCIRSSIRYQFFLIWNMPYHDFRDPQLNQYKDLNFLIN